MSWSLDHELTLAELAEVFGPKDIEFSKARGPADQLLDLTKEAIKTRGRR